MKKTNNNEYTILINNKYIYINNYKKIIDISENELYIELERFNLKVKGNNIKITKMIDNEIKFDGTIESINYYYK